MKHRAHDILGISSLQAFLHGPTSFLRGLAARGGGVQRRRLGTKQFVFVFDPEAAQEVLVQRAAVFPQSRLIFDRIRPVTGKRGLVQLAGEASRGGRARSRSLFTEEALRSAAQAVEELTSRKLRELEGRPAVDPAKEMSSLILETALRIFLGAGAEKLAGTMGADFLRLNQLCGRGMRSLVPAPLQAGSREVRRLERNLRAALATHLVGAAGPATGVPAAFAGDPALADHCLTFLFAGHETTASSLAFTLLLLGRRPDLQREIAAGNQLAALHAYKESLRLFPPAYMLVREAAERTELLGQRVERGDQVVIALASIHRDRRLHPDPHSFRPERFQERPAHPFAFLPFGAGGKSCVGERLAYLEAGIVLRRFCERFVFEAPARPIAAEALITLHPRAGQELHLRAREGGAHARAL